MSPFRVQNLPIKHFSKIQAGHTLVISHSRPISNSFYPWLRFQSRPPRCSTNPCISQPRSAKCSLPNQPLSLHRVSTLVSVISQQPRKFLQIQSIQISTSPSLHYSALPTATRHFASQAEAVDPKPFQSPSKECPTTSKAQVQAQAQPKAQSTSEPDIKVVAQIVPKGFSSVSDPPLSPPTVPPVVPSATVNDIHEAVMDEARAMREFMLSETDLERIPHSQSRNPYLGSGYDSYGEKPMIFVYRREDVQRAAYEKYGGQRGFEQYKATIEDDEMLMRNIAWSMRKQEREMRRPDRRPADVLPSGTALPATAAAAAGTQSSTATTQSPSPSPSPSPASAHRNARFNAVRSAGGVVQWAILVNALNFAMKAVGWIFTGSHSMFAETVHSLVDTGQQAILALGIRQSLRRPDLLHPYGYSQMSAVMSLICGVGIFFMGAGVNIYHGLHGLWFPQVESERLAWAILMLGGSFISEGSSFYMAFKHIREAAKNANEKFIRFVLSGSDPSVNVVLLEDAMGIAGVLLAAGCMTITHMTGSHYADCIGSLAIGALLGVVASFIIYRNTQLLLGRSIPQNQIEQITKIVEKDLMVRGVYDVKATDIGNSTVRFKAEVDVDGRYLTKLHLKSLDPQKLLKEMQSVASAADAEKFLLYHGERIVDLLGAEINQIEHSIQENFPTVRHIDIEIN